MNDSHERIHKLLHDGKISPAEATALLEALADTTDTGDTGTVTAAATRTSETSPTSFTPPTPPASPTPPATPHVHTETSHTETSHTNNNRPKHETQPKTQHETQREVEINLNGTIGHAFSEVFSRGFRYAFGTDPDGTPEVNIPDVNNPNLEPPLVHVHNRLGNVTISLDTTISEPVVIPEDEDTPAADIFRPHDQDEDYPTDVFVVRLLTRANSTVHIPEGYAVSVDSGAGNVRIRDVLRVWGTVNAGNAKVTGVRSLNLVINAGNANVVGRFDKGEHRLVTNAGNAKVMLQDGSSLTVHARVTAGNIKHKGNWQDVTVVREMVSSKLEGRICAGDAVMTLKAKAGNISVYAPDSTQETGDDSDD